MRAKLLFTLMCASVTVAACVPRRPPVVVPPPPPPPPPPVTLSPEEEARERETEAQRSWEQGTLSGRQGRWNEAERFYRHAAALRPALPTYHMALATALLQQGKESEGADAMLAGIRAEEALPRPNHRVLAVDYERVIQILERLNRLDEARLARERQRFHRTMRDATPSR